jgi:sulfite reductase (NADPH) flavoprotein alpha-component
VSGDFDPEQKRYLEGFVAAMGLQDCGQCGCNCLDYSDAILFRNEERLNRCVRGGQGTTRTFKALHQELSNLPASPPPLFFPPQTEVATGIPMPVAATAAPAVAPGFSREHPVMARFLARSRLTNWGAQKETWHIELDLSDAEAIAFGTSLEQCGRYQQGVY